VTVELLWLVIAVCAVAVAVSAAVVALALWRLAADGRAATARAERLLTMLDAELPPTLAALRSTSAELDALAGESAARLVLLERLAEEGQETMVAVRELSGSVNEILRGPADTVSGVRRSVSMVGTGISHGADRLRRAIAGDGPEDGPGAGSGGPASG
jgi:hypothetical protein